MPAMRAVRSVSSTVTSPPSSGPRSRALGPRTERLPHARFRGAVLPLVLAPHRFAAIRTGGGRREAGERQLADGHAGVDEDGPGGHVGEFQGDASREARVYPARRGVTHA